MAPRSPQVYIQVSSMGLQRHISFPLQHHLGPPFPLPFNPQYAPSHAILQPCWVSFSSLCRPQSFSHLGFGSFLFFFLNIYLFLFIHLAVLGLKLQHVRSSSLTRDWTPALGVWSLSHWTSREVPLGLGSLITSTSYTSLLCPAFPWQTAIILQIQPQLLLGEQPSVQEAAFPSLQSQARTPVISHGLSQGPIAMLITLSTV